VGEQRLRYVRTYLLNELLAHSPDEDICSAGLWVASALDSEILELFNALVNGRISIEYKDCGFNFVEVE